MSKRVNIAHIGDGPWFDFKSDIIFGLFHALSDSGVDVSITQNVFDEHEFNLIVGADWLTNSTSLQYLKLLKKGYAIFEVEHYCGGFINGKEDWPAAIYNELIANARFVASPYISNVQDITDSVPNQQNVFYTPWGRHNVFKNPRVLRVDQPENFLVFIGMIKGTREQEIRRIGSSLKKGAHIKVWDGSGPRELLNYHLSKAAAVLNINHQPEQKILNPFRILSAVESGVPMVTCPHYGADPDRYFDFMYSLEAGEMSAEHIYEEITRKPLEHILDSIPMLVTNLRPLVDSLN